MTNMTFNLTLNLRKVIVKLSPKPQPQLDCAGIIIKIFKLPATQPPEKVQASPKSASLWKQKLVVYMSRPQNIVWAIVYFGPKKSKITKKLGKN